MHIMLRGVFQGAHESSAKQKSTPKLTRTGVLLLGIVSAKPSMEFSPQYASLGNILFFTISAVSCAHGLKYLYYFLLLMHAARCALRDGREKLHQEGAENNI